MYQSHDPARLPSGTSLFSFSHRRDPPYLFNKVKSPPLLTGIILCASFVIVVAHVTLIVFILFIWRRYILYQWAEFSLVPVGIIIFQFHLHPTSGGRPELFFVIVQLDHHFHLQWWSWTHPSPSKVSKSSTWFQIQIYPRLKALPFSIVLLLDVSVSR